VLSGKLTTRELTTRECETCDGSHPAAVGLSQHPEHSRFSVLATSAIPSLPTLPHAKLAPPAHDGHGLLRWHRRPRFRGLAEVYKHHVITCNHDRFAIRVHLLDHDPLAPTALRPAGLDHRFRTPSGGRIPQEENRILRSKLPTRITVTPQERARLVKLGTALGGALKAIITIVSPRTFARWVVGTTAAKARPAVPRRGGRPPTAEDIRNLVIQIATDNAWGSLRVADELRKLGIRNVSRSTVVNILREAPTTNPDSAWVTQQARNASMQMQDWELSCDYLITDHDPKFTGSFNAVFEAEGAEVIRVGPSAPNLNAYAE
jgi:hypothetical protein